MKTQNIGNESADRETRQGQKSKAKATALIWFNVSVLYSALCAGAAVGATSGPHRTALVFLAVHGGLWAIYRAMELIEAERA